MEFSYMIRKLLILSLLLTSWSYSQTYIVPPLQRDDFDQAKTWWEFLGDGTQDPPTVQDGYMHAILDNPLNGGSGLPLDDDVSLMQNVGIITRYKRPIYNKDHIVSATIRVRTLNNLPVGSRGWGMWRSEELPISYNQSVWFFEQTAHPDSVWAATETWWRSRITKGVNLANNFYVDLESHVPPISNQDWHTYRIYRRARQYYETYVDGELIQHIIPADFEDHAILNADYSFNCWNDNLVYYFRTNPSSGEDEILIWTNGWLGQSQFIVDFVEISTSGYDPSFSITMGSPVLHREVFSEIDDGISDGLWKSLNFSSLGGNVVVIATGKAEDIDPYDDDDDMKLILNSTDYGYNTAQSWNGQVDGGIPRTLIFETTLAEATHQISLESEVTPILYDVTVFGSPGGAIVLNQDVYDSAPSGSNNTLYHSYNFSCDAGQAAIYISAIADEEPGWDHLGANINGADDDEMRIEIDSHDYGWTGDSAFVGNVIMGDVKTLVIRENLSAGTHSLKFYANQTPSLLKVLVYAENGDYSLPVELSRFSLETIPEGRKLTWQTASEINNFGFHVYRAESADSLAPAEENFRKISSAIIPGRGNSSDETGYEYIDSGSLPTGWIWYRLQSLGIDGSSEFHPAIRVKSNPALPEQPYLFPNFPNPFNPLTNIAFQLAEQTGISLTVYDVQGRLVRQLAAGNFPAGVYQYSWNGEDQSGRASASGLYFCRLQTENYSLIRKMLLQR